MRKVIDLGPVTTKWAWQAAAACRGMSIDLFYGADSLRGRSKRAHEVQAKFICASCPVTEQCLTWAIDVGEPEGIWGGLTVEECDAL